MKMEDQIGPIRMHNETGDAIREATKIAKSRSSAEFMRNASEKEALRVIKKALGDERRRGQG